MDFRVGGVRNGRYHLEQKEWTWLCWAHAPGPPVTSPRFLSSELCPPRVPPLHVFSVRLRALQRAGSHGAFGLVCSTFKVERGANM